MGELALGDGAQIGNLGVLLLEKRGQLFLNEAVEFVEPIGGESVAALHDNLVAADRGRDLAFRGQHWLVIKVLRRTTGYAGATTKPARGKCTHTSPISRS